MTLAYETPAPPKRQAGLAFILVTLLIDVLGIGLIIPVLPQLVADLKGFAASDPVRLKEAAPTYAALIALYSANQFLFAPLLGALSDRFGRRPILLISLFGTGVDYMIMFLAPHLWVLVIGRIINGITAGNMTTCYAYIADVTPEDQRAKKFGLMGAVFGVGFILGPVTGGLLGMHNHRLPFLFASGLAMANVLYGYFVLPESHKQENRKAFNLKKANPFGALLELRKFHGVAPLAAILLLFYFATFCLHSSWVVYTGYKFNWGPREVGLSLCFVGVLAGAVQGGLTGRVVKKIGEYNTFYIGMAFQALAFALYGWAPFGWTVYAFMLFGAVGGFVGPSAQALIANKVGATNQGLAQGAFSSLSALASITAPLVANGLFDRFAGHFQVPGQIAEIPGIAFYLASVVTLVAFFLALAFLKRPVVMDAPATIDAPAAAPAH